MFLENALSRYNSNQFTEQIMIVKKPKVAINRRSEILNEICYAKFSIWIVLPAFPDNELFDLLIGKIVEGINVEIVLLNNSIHKTSKIPYFQEFIDAGGEFFTVSEAFYEKIKQKRFLIIDNKTIIKSIENVKSMFGNNYEKMMIIRNSKTIIKQFTKGYFHIKNLFATSIFYQAKTPDKYS
jgi:hypothetical protein